MAFLGLRRGDITVHGLGNEEGFAVRWHRLLLALQNTSALHFAPVASDHVPAAPEGHTGPMVLAPIDEDSPTPPSDDLAGSAVSQLPAVDAPADQPAADLVGLLGEVGPDPLWHPPYFLTIPVSEEPGSPTAAPVHDPSDSLLPKSDAVLWHGPALLIFPGEPHDTADAAAPPAAPPDTAGSGTPDTAGTGTPDVADTPPPDTAGTPDAVTRADLDPVLAAMGSGAEHAALSDPGSGDLGAAFLPPGADDLPHGLDSGMLLTPPPIPPPPDVI